ncbi:MAG TPA: hypothetical protein VLB81_06660 [Gaiellales bacterium]|nr:hypothetical protein [Gaiellales bacterium]
MGTTVVRVEHPVPDYEIWKREAFDRDPLGRERSGVRRHRVLRRGERPSLVAVELEFDDRAAAEAFAAELREMWGRVRERFGWRDLPEAQLFEITEVEEY